MFKISSRKNDLQWWSVKVDLTSVCERLQWPDGISERRRNTFMKPIVWDVFDDIGWQSTFMDRRERTLCDLLRTSSFVGELKRYRVLVLLSEISLFGIWSVELIYGICSELIWRTSPTWKLLLWCTGTIGRCVGSMIR